MKFEVNLERHYPHPVEAVWQALATAEGISAWLLQTDDFVAEAGHAFTMYCVNDDGGRDEYRCRVLALEPSQRMRWSWVLAGNEHLGETEVEFNISATDTGTQLQLTHAGDRDREMLERFKSGWTQKLEQLAEVVAAQA